jgi:CubicO group peptidase (beta-lactamase class C family)
MKFPFSAFRQIAFACCLCLLLVLSERPPAAARQAQPEFAELEKVVLDELKATSTPGAAIGIVRGDRPGLRQRLRHIERRDGRASHAQHALPTRLDDEDVHLPPRWCNWPKRASSNSTIPIGKHAKGLSPKIAQLTSHQLLSHTGGLRDDAVMFGEHDDAALGETVRGLKDDFLFTEPGRIFSYSNAGYWLAGFVVEQVSGKALR